MECTGHLVVLEQTLGKTILLRTSAMSKENTPVLPVTTKYKLCSETGDSVSQTWCKVAGEGCETTRCKCVLVVYIRDTSVTNGAAGARYLSWYNSHVPTTVRSRSIV